MKCATDWSLLKGRTVEVRQDGDVLRRATIEDATEDGQVVWLAQQGNALRQLLSRHDGLELWTTDASFG